MFKEEGYSLKEQLKWSQKHFIAILLWGSISFSCCPLPGSAIWCAVASNMLFSKLNKGKPEFKKVESGASESVGGVTSTEDEHNVSFSSNSSSSEDVFEEGEEGEISSEEESEEEKENDDSDDSSDNEDEKEKEEEKKKREIKLFKEKETDIESIMDKIRREQEEEEEEEEGEDDDSEIMIEKEKEEKKKGLEPIIEEEEEEEEEGEEKEEHEQEGIMYMPPFEASTLKRALGIGNINASLLDGEKKNDNNNKETKKKITDDLVTLNEEDEAILKEVEEMNIEGDDEKENGKESIHIKGFSMDENLESFIDDFMKKENQNEEEDTQKEEEENGDDDIII